MTNRDGDSGRAPGILGSLPSLTRRQVLIGGTAIAIGGPAAAEDFVPRIEVEYEDAARRALLINAVKTGNPKDTRTLRLAASSFGNPDAAGGAGRFVRSRTKDGWRVEIARGSFPGGFQFRLQIDILWKPAQAEQPAASSMTLRLIKPGPNIELTVTDLLRLLLDESADAPNKLSGRLPGIHTTALIRSLFGETVDTSGARDIQLALYRGGHWLLSALKGRFAALSDEGVTIGFRNIAFGFLSDQTGLQGKTFTTFELEARGDDEASWSGELPRAGSWEKDKKDVRALFEGIGAPPAPGGTLTPPPPAGLKALPVAQRKGKPAPASSPDAANAVADDGAQTSARVLYGFARPDFGGALSFGTGPETEVLLAAPPPPSSLKLATPGHNLGPEPSRPERFAAWRNAGNGPPVFAFSAPLNLKVQRAAKDASVFAELKGTIWRVQTEAGVRYAAALEPTKAGQTIKTRFGPFTVSPLPPLSARPGVKARVPSIVTGGLGSKGRRQLTHFAAPMALEQAAVSLDDCGDVFSLLTFNQSECLFRLHEVPLARAWTGPELPKTDPPQAEAIIHIGALPPEGLAVRLSLSRAMLKVKRARDLLDLSYRFQDLLLERHGTGKDAKWWVVPDRRMAAFVPHRPPTPPREVPAACNDPEPGSSTPSRYDAGQDPRPLMVVEFPPQHIAEQAFFRQFKADPSLPTPPAGTEATDAEVRALESRALIEILIEEDRDATPSERTKARMDRRDVRKAVSANQIKKCKEVIDAAAENKKNEALQAESRKCSAFKAFVDAFKAEAENPSLPGDRPLPEDQQIYVGARFLDLESNRVARRVARRAEKQENDAQPNDLQGRTYRLRALPHVDVQRRELEQLWKDIKGASEPFDPEREAALQPGGDNASYVAKREDLKDRSSFEYKSFRDFFRKHRDGSQPAAYAGRDSYAAFVESLPDAARKKAVDDIVAVVAAFDAAQDTAKDSFSVPAEARVSGRSRLVFRIAADDFEEGRPDRVDRRPAGSFPFTLTALTNWGAHDMAVVRRAEKVFEPLAGWVQPDGTSRPNGRAAQRWARSETRDEAEKLLHQGLTRGDAWSIRLDEGRDCKPTLVNRLGLVLGAQRMAEIAASVREAPRWHETAIEMPFRLILSPAQDALWQTPLPLPPELKLTPPRDSPVPLWHAQLYDAPGASSLRAIWSPDFRAEALLDSEIGGPPRGPWAPWAMPRSVTSRDPYREDESAQVERFRTSMDAYDRHELVALTSLHGLPVRGRRKPDGSLDSSQINPPPGFRLRDVATEVLDPKIDPTEKDWSAIYRPQPLGVTELTLTALGGTLKADTSFVPPASAKVTRPNVPNLFDALSIERWRHDAVLGRDIRVEVVYKGFLYPLGHRASLVKLTERRFFADPAFPKTRPPVAFLVQRMFLRVGLPEKRYPAIAQPNGGRRWPAERVEILTRVTPDIIDPTDALDPGAPTDPNDLPTREASNGSGRLFLRVPKSAKVRPGLVFWPRVRRREGGEVKFELQIDKRGARVRMPLLFVDNTAANDEAAMTALTAWYNRLTDPVDAANKPLSPDPRCIMEHAGAMRRYAAEKEPDDTSFETTHWILAAEGREATIPGISSERNFTFHNTSYDFGSLQQGADQPPFYPVMRQAKVRIAQVDRLVGKATDPIPVRFDPEYQAFGFPKDEDLAPESSQYRGAKTDVYLDFEKEVQLDPGASGDRTGGAARPTTKLIALSRSRGPVGSDKAVTETPSTETPAKTSPESPGKTPSLPAASTQFNKPDAAKFFDPDAKILGILSFKEALRFIASELSQTPEFKEVTQYASSLIQDAQAAERDLGKAVTKVRDGLLIPLRDALTTLAQEFSRAVAGTGRQLDDAVAVAMAEQRLAQLYPDVGRSYRDLREALDKAISASTAVRDFSELLSHFAGIYSAGRRFLRAIERVSADPVAPVRAALRDAFNDKIADLIDFASSVLGEIGAELRRELGAIERQVRDQIERLLGDPMFVAWRRIVFALPGVYMITPESVQVAVEREIDQAFDRAIEAGNWVDALASGRQNVPEVLNELATLLNDALDDSIKTAHDAGNTVLENGLIAARDAWGTGNFAAPGDRLKGLLYEQVTDLLSKLLLSAIGVSRSVTGAASVRALLESLNTLGDAAAELVRPMIEGGLEAAKARCSRAANVIAVLLNEIAPQAGIPSSVAGDIASLNTALDSLVSTISIYETAADLPDKSLSEAAGALRSQLRAAASGLDKAVTALALAATALRAQATAFTRQACELITPENIRTLPLDAMAALASARQALLVTSRDFSDRLGKVLTGSGAQFPDFANKLRAVAGETSGATTARNNALRALVQAVLRTGLMTVGVSQLAHDVSSLQTARLLPAPPPPSGAPPLPGTPPPPATPEALPLTKAAVDDLQTGLAAVLGATRAAEIVAPLRTSLTTIETLANTLRALAERDRSRINAIVLPTPTNVDAVVAYCEQQMGSAIVTATATLTRISDELVRDGEQRLLRAAAEGLAVGEVYRSEAISLLKIVLKPAMSALASAQAQLVQRRDNIYRALDPDTGPAPAPSDQEIKDFLKDLGQLTVEKVRAMLLVARPADARPGKGNLRRVGDDYLTAEAVELNQIAALLAGTTDPTSEELKKIIELFGDWRNNRASAVLLATQLRAAADAVLSGDLPRIVDLEGARRRIEGKLKEMIPSKVALSYGLGARLNKFGDIFLPQPDSRITINAAASYDLLDAQKPPVFTATCRIDPFDINLFDVVRLMFDGVHFVNDSRTGSDFKLRYNDFKLGKKAEFIKPLQSYLNPAGSGPYVVALRGSPGIEAGYSLDLGTIMVGSVSFTNVSLNAACRLPFDNRQAIFTTSIGRRDKPFLISCLPYTGGGFLALLATSKRIIGFEASFEFGGGGAFKFGLLEGKGRICLGIYVNQVESTGGGGEQGCTIDGFFYAGGEAHITRFSVSATLVVRISQQPGGSMQGSAVFTYSFSLGVADIEFKIGVQKREGKGFSGSKSASLFGPTRYAQAGASGASLGDGGGAVIESRAVSQHADWKHYQTYFTDDLNGFAA